MSWLSKKVDQAKRDGVSVSKAWGTDTINRIARAVARTFTGSTLFICNTCHGKWNQPGKVRNTPIGWVKQDTKNSFLSSAVVCPYCERGSVRPKGGK